MGRGVLAIEDAPKRPQFTVDFEPEKPRKKQRRPPVLSQSVLDRLTITPLGQRLIERMSVPSMPVSVPAAERMIRAAFVAPTSKRRAAPYAAP